MATTATLERSFTYNGAALPDPMPGMSVEDVRAFYASRYPDLATATVTGPEERSGKLEYAFKRAIGTKG